MHDIIFADHRRSEDGFQQQGPAKILPDPQQAVLSNYQGAPFCDGEAFEGIWGGQENFPLLAWSGGNENIVTVLLPLNGAASSGTSDSELARLGDARLSLVSCNTVPDAMSRTTTLISVSLGPFEEKTSRTLRDL